MKRTNIMLSEEQHKKLTRYAKKEGRTLGGLIRDAVDYVYQDKDLVEQRRQVAISAYEEGFISLGKLAEVLGLDPLSTRKYLRTHGKQVHTQDKEAVRKDAADA